MKKIIFILVFQLISLLFLASCATSSTVMKQTDRKNQTSTSLKPISEEEAAKIVDADIKKETEKPLPTDVSFIGYSIVESKLYYDQNKKLVWEYTIRLKYKQKDDIISIPRGVIIDAVTGEILKHVTML